MPGATYPQTIVVGYDGSEEATHALARAALLAKTFGSTLVVTVVEELVPLASEPIGMGVATASPLVETGWNRELQIERARAALDGQEVTLEIESPVGPPASALVEVADERHADLIVVGTSDPGLLERLFAGSVSGSVARTAHCDVLVVRSAAAAV